MSNENDVDKKLNVSTTFIKFIDKITPIIKQRYYSIVQAKTQLPVCNGILGKPSMPVNTFKKSIYNVIDIIELASSYSHTLDELCYIINVLKINDSTLNIDIQCTHESVKIRSDKVSITFTIDDFIDLKVSESAKIVPFGCSEPFWTPDASPFNANTVTNDHIESIYRDIAKILTSRGTKDDIMNYLNITNSDPMNKHKLFVRVLPTDNGKKNMYVYIEATLQTDIDICIIELDEFDNLVKMRFDGSVVSKGCN